MMKKRNNRQFLAAALAAALVTSQFSFATVMGESIETVQENSMIPDNITIEQPVPLSEINLPKSEHGTLSWVDDSLVPSSRVQSYEVIFHPYDRADLAGFEEWDGESDTVCTNITIVVSSISEENECGVPGELDDPDENTSDKEPEAEILPENAAGSNENESSKIQDSDKNDSETDPSDEQLKEADVSASDRNEKTEDTDAASQLPENPAEGIGSEQEEGGTSSGETEAPEMPEENIFDSSEEIQDGEFMQITDAEPSDEEKSELAEANHTCNGITVSGIDLPWYVQFRVASGEKYEFSNEADANVFKAYEFELWDLRNNTEYEIPDGQYISVTVPVRAGYDYTIEHILDSGAMETIIPSVDGSTMVFSTHSFSPFGIAGSKVLVGEEIEDGSYSSDDALSADVTVTPVTTDTQSGDRTNTTTTDSTVSAAADGTTQNAADSTEQNQEDADSTSSQAVNTGDDTPILPFVLIGVAAIVLIGVIIYLRKKK